MRRCFFFLLGWLLFWGASVTSVAATFGKFTYTVSGDMIVITDYPSNATGAVVIPETIEGKPVRVIGVTAFFECSGLTSITLPSTLTTISTSAFVRCGGLTSMVIPEGVTTIGAQAFLYCTGITSLHIPASVMTFGAGPFGGCTGLQSVTVDASNPNFCSVDGVLYNKEQTALVQCPAGKEGTLVIPPTVRNIPTFGVSRASKLTHVTLPPALVTMGDSAFHMCSSLVEVVIPEGVAVLGANAFQLCTSLQSISVPASVTSIGSGVFLQCSSLASVTIAPDNPNFEVVDGVLFNKTTGMLMSYPMPRQGGYVIPDGTVTISPSAFSYCDNLTSVDFPPSVRTIMTSSFSSCGGLRKLRIGAGVTLIGESGFSSCANLESVVFPATLQTIGHYAFSGCPKLLRFVFEGEAPSLGVSVTSSVSGQFRVGFFEDAAYFSSPTWRGYQSVNMGPATPVKSWLVRHHLPYDSSLAADPDNDGVKLLMAYALALDPDDSPSTKLPKAAIEDGNLKLPFHAGAPGISYTVESSTDLEHWTSEGVVLSPADADQIRTATVQAGDPARFLRLVVAE